VVDDDVSQRWAGSWTHGLGLTLIDARTTFDGGPTAAKQQHAKPTRRELGRWLSIAAMANAQPPESRGLPMKGQGAPVAVCTTAT
jgi:hypothetical protein